MNPFGLLLVGATTLFPAYQLFSLPNISDQTALFAQYMGMAALILMAWVQLLAARPAGIELVFGGLDRIYVLHKWAGILAIGALFLHETIGAEMRGLGPETGLNDLAETLGEVSYNGLLALVALSIATFVPYHLWKWTHKAMGALFLAGAVHFFLILKPFAMVDPAGLFTGFFCIAGIAAYIWTLLPTGLRPSHGYRIVGLDRTGGALAISLKPDGRGIRARPGQFGVFRFTGSGRTEPHPFSFSALEPDGSLRVTVKTLGDFTAGLNGTLKVGQTVRVHGPFGRFRPDARGRQVWIAGGIGVTPFLAAAKALNSDAEPVHLFYCVRSRLEAPHLDEVEALAHARPNLNLHLIVSGHGARLTGDLISQTIGADLARARVLFCGPIGLRQALQTGLRRHGVSARRFHYEAFAFRTGIGLKRLALWLLNRWRSHATPLEVAG